ncbi:hypothetical protein [Stenotrophomonas sp. PS02289]|uniref:hypothetical protein n=1 Tax=Stenotrophomonas sp. PS02289 TaxID=2991422 RepID=UPI00249BBAA5|nr:hypothetical protein [Stenotrophomonas sp. PS02289]
MRSVLISAVLASALIAAPVQAETHDLSDKAMSYAAIGSFVTLYVVTSPVWLTSAAVDKLSARSKANGKKTAGKAGRLPPLTVEKVETQADGAVEVTLKNPEAAEDLAVVQWPARDDSPGKALKVGDVLDFTPTDVGAGWMVANAQGETLAFMPTDDAAKSQMSEAY